MAEGSIPVLLARGTSLAETWENALLLLYREGCDIHTEYDGDPDSARPSKDATMTMVVDEPASEPLIHRAFPGGLVRQEQEKRSSVHSFFIMD